MFVWKQVLRRAGRAVVFCAFAAATLHVARAAPGQPALYPPTVAGPQVKLDWTPVAGAHGYRLAIGLNPAGPELYSHLVGPHNSFTFASPYVGTAYITVQAFDHTGLGARSNVVQATVRSLAPVPAAPVNLQAFISGTAVTLTWAGGAGGAAPQAVWLEAGSAPGAANLASTLLPISTHLTVPHLGPGSYFVRVYAVNASGRSLPSNEVRIDMIPGGGCTPPPASSLASWVSGNSVGLAWAPVAGVTGYRLDVASGPSGPVVVSTTYPPSVTSVVYTGAPAGTFYARVTTGAACGAQTPSSVVTFTVAGSTGGPRTPNPPPGQRLRLPNMESVAVAVGNAYRGDLRNSCREHGGNNVWLFRLVQELRRYDTRWGLNWKRGNVGDMSQDIVTYNFSAGADEGTTNVYIIDVISGHCGSNPEPSWIDNTDATRQAGAIGRWTLQPYIAAGWRP